MSKLPVNKKTWKTFIPTKWMVWACEPNDVHHLIKSKGKTTWVNTANMDDCKKVVVFDKLPQVKKFISKCIKGKLLPTAVDHIEYAQVVPTFEEGKLWYEVYNAKKNIVGDDKVIRIDV